MDQEQHDLFGPEGHPHLKIPDSDHPTPWKSNDEWIQYYKLLFCDESDLVKQALDYYASFNAELLSSRYAVYSATCELIRRLQFPLSNRPDQIAALSFSIIRFVSLIVDQCNTKRDRFPIGKMSMKDACGLIGIPAFIVELRHKITHDTDKVQLDECTSAAQEAVKWLKRMYWDAEFNEICVFPAPKCSDEKKVKEIRACLDSYMEASLRIEFLGVDAENWKSKELMKFRDFITEDVEAFCQVLVCDYFLVPRMNVWYAFEISHSTEFENQEKLVYGKRIDYLLHEVSLKLWCPVIKMLVSPTRKPILCNYLSSELLNTTMPDYITSCLNQWMRFMLRLAQPFRQKIIKEGGVNFNTNFLDAVDWDKIGRGFSKSQAPYLVNFSKLALKHHELRKPKNSKKEDITQIVEAEIEIEAVTKTPKSSKEKKRKQPSNKKASPKKSKKMIRNVKTSPKVVNETVNYRKHLRSGYDE